MFSICFYKQSTITYSKSIIKRLELAYSLTSTIAFIEYCVEIFSLLYSGNILGEIDDHFSNGFRKELKDHISTIAETWEEELTSKAAASQQKHEEILTAVISFKAALESPRIWLKAFIFLGSLFGVIAAIVTVILKLMGQS